MNRRFSKFVLQPAAWLVAVGLGLGDLGAGTKIFSTSQFTSVQSRTGQFVVTSPNSPDALLTPPPLPLTARPPSATIDLQPAQAAVICERVKEALLRELGMKDQWRGKILILLRPAAQLSGMVHVQSIRYRDGWQYRLEMPDQVETNRLVRALTQTLLGEIANRRSPERAAEIPLWLTEGLAVQLLDANPTAFLLNLNTQFSFTTRLPDPLREARRWLGKNSALSFADLSLPAGEQLHGAAWEGYRRSAQVFVAHLLNLPDGRAALRELLAQLPNYLNPQFAFLKAFEVRFQSTLDVEKWWSATLVNFSGRDQHSRWSAADTLRRMEEILVAPVEMRADTNSLPLRGEFSLQLALAGMDYAAQRPLVQQRLQQFQLLHGNAPPELARLIADYHAALSAYLQRRDNLSAAPARGRAPDSARLAAAEVVRQLNLLDDIRRDFAQFGGPAAQGGPQER